MPSSCKDIREAVAQCLQNSDCVLIHRNSPGDCVRPPLKDTLPSDCLHLLHGYGQCKKGMIDMRKRFRGNKPVANSVELEAGGGRNIKPVPMLYAGRNDFDELAAKEKASKDAEYEAYTRNDGIEDVRKK